MLNYTLFFSSPDSTHLLAMLGITHMLFSGTMTCLISGSTDPAILLVGAVAGLLPDIDISTSMMGRMLPGVSNWFEERFPHRSCTHSVFASGVVAIVTYTPVMIFNQQLLPIAYAINIAYFFSWLIDACSRAGIEMFFPISKDRYVFPGNRNFRLKTGSRAEYIFLAIVFCCSLAVFNINSQGGILTNFNRVMATTSGVEQIYNQSGSTNLIIAHIQGVRTSDRQKINDRFLIIQKHDTGFIVRDSKGEIYKVGNDETSQIQSERITADVGAVAVTNFKTIYLDSEPVSDMLLPHFSSKNSYIYVSGQIEIDDPESLRITQSPHLFQTISLSGKTVKLEAAPIRSVIKRLGEQYATGELHIKTINTSEAEYK